MNGKEPMDCPFGCGNTFRFYIEQHNNMSYWVSKQSITSSIDPFKFRDILPLLILSNEKDIADRIYVVE